MKIDDRFADYMNLLQNDDSPAPVKGSASAVVERSGAAADAVELSAEAAALADDQARRERLDIIRRQLAEGSYNISGKDVADKMLNILKG